MPWRGYASQHTFVAISCWPVDRSAEGRPVDRAADTSIARDKGWVVSAPPHLSAPPPHRSAPVSDTRAERFGRACHSRARRVDGTEGAGAEGARVTHGRGELSGRRARARRGEGTGAESRMAR